MAFRKGVDLPVLQIGCNLKVDSSTEYGVSKSVTKRLTGGWMGKKLGRSKVKVSKDSADIQEVYDANGGTRGSARLSGYSPELLSIWKRRGRVPLKKVAEMANKLACNPYILNRKEVTELVDAVNDYADDN